MNVLTLFATYGFRKVSMGDIAKAADLSRQSIYNQYGSKEAVLDWAVGNMLDQVTGEAVACLEVHDGDTGDVLAAAFQAWIGDHVSIVKGTPHGGEILDTAMESAASSSRNFEAEFLNAVIAFLSSRKVFASQETAQEAAFVLHLASKGLLLKAQTSEDFQTGMRRVIDLVIGAH